ncbi:hypothetical protein [Halorubrum sodomense]|uniref:hypothetical protein n=1 Tax=Halorubrum sodomense TaxID=35743 RepID=UPI000A45B623|nr:hypothetical protein [Halorubrum sodomense]
MGFKSLVDRDGSGTVTIDKQHLELDGLVADDGSIKEADANTQRVGERAPGALPRGRRSADAVGTRGASVKPRGKGVLDATPWDPT